MLPSRHILIPVFAFATLTLLRDSTDKPVSNRGDNSSLLDPENPVCYFPWKTSSATSLWSRNMVYYRSLSPKDGKVL